MSERQLNENKITKNLITKRKKLVDKSQVFDKHKLNEEKNVDRLGTALEGLAKLQKAAYSTGAVVKSITKKGRDWVVTFDVGDPAVTDMYSDLLRMAGAQAYAKDLSRDRGGTEVYLTLKEL